jgi:hypothetical protein
LARPPQLHGARLPEDLLQAQILRLARRIGAASIEKRLPGPAMP